MDKVENTNVCIASSPPQSQSRVSKAKSKAAEPSTCSSETKSVSAQMPLELGEPISTQESLPENKFPVNNSGNPVQEDLIFDIDDIPSQLNPNSLGDRSRSSMATVPDIEQPGSHPWLSDLFSDGDAKETHGQVVSRTHQHSAPKSDFSFSALLSDQDVVEDIVRQSDPNVEHWLFQNPGMGHSIQSDGLNSTPRLPMTPDFAAGSPELLVVRFDQLTCGILSVKDGIHENPWRTLIWPLAKDTPALYHAIFSLAAFHSCRESPEMRVQGVSHMRQSITLMVQDIQNMRTDAALATSLALAFADTWDQHTRTCIEHLRGAKALVSQVLKAGMQNGFNGEELERVRFLYNTWFYMDVIARLTSLNECGDQDVDSSLFHLPRDAIHEIDPLMGCATTLFPLINQVARLIQRVRRSESNSISLISEAIELKGLVEQWQPPTLFEPPEDPTSEVQHSIQTAHAYQWATLLYLHQAVPEMPSEPAVELAKRVLILLATVPASSRTTIIQMFPLLAAGCEAEEEEDRNWVLNRWMVIQSRLMLGGIDRCLEVVREVWARRDAFHANAQQQSSFPNGRPAPYLAMNNPGVNALWNSSIGQQPAPTSAAVAISRRNSTVPPLENIEFEKTVRGRLHWVDVMKEWGWEGKQQRNATQHDMTF